VVLTKPGFGIVSEAIVNAKPMVYAARDDWAETSVLVDGIRRFVRAAPITAGQLYSGDIETALRSAMNSPPPTETATTGGATIAARRIREWLP
jgi:L-arabinokinase